MFLTIDTSNVKTAFELSLSAMVAIFAIMIVIFLLVKLLNLTDKYNDRIKGFFTKIFLGIKNLFVKIFSPVKKLFTRKKTKTAKE